MIEPLGKKNKKKKKKEKNTPRIFPPNPPERTRHPMCARSFSHSKEPVPLAAQMHESWATKIFIKKRRTSQEASGPKELFLLLSPLRFWYSPSDFCLLYCLAPQILVQPLRLLFSGVCLVNKPFKNPIYHAALTQWSSP